MPLTMAQSVTSLRHAWGELNSRGVRSNFLIFSPGLLTHKICYLLILPGFLKLNTKHRMSLTMMVTMIMTVMMRYSDCDDGDSQMES